MWTIFKGSIEFVTVVLPFSLFCLGGILAPLRGALECELSAMERQGSPLPSSLTHVVFFLPTFFPLFLSAQNISLSLAVSGHSCTAF